MGYHARMSGGALTADFGACSDAEHAGAQDRYDLAAALRVVRGLETSAARAAVFDEIKAKNALYRMVDAIYSGAGPLQPLALLAYMVKSVVSVGPRMEVRAQAVSISNFDNEHRAIERVAELIPNVRLSRLTLSRRHMFSPGPMREGLRILLSAWRTWPFLSRLARSYSFMPAARIASALAYYMLFVRTLADHRSVNAAIVPSNYSPEAIGLAAAAHRTGRRVVYINHAPVPANGPLMPPVLADCAIFYGDAIRRTYESRSRCVAEVALIGQPWVSRRMEWRDEIGTVGIFLTAGTKTEAVVELVSSIRATHPDARILIRNHPVALLKTDFSELAARYDMLTVTIGNTLDEEIAACDLIICGNSGVAMNAASGGRPVAYIDGLDKSLFDYNGFIESGLICHVKRWSAGVYSQLKDFYERREWRAIMRSYDASYEADAQMLKRAAAEIVNRYVAASPATA